MKKIESTTIDFILVDLPYGQSACHWDVKICLKRMWEELKRIIKPNAILAFFTTTKFGNELINSNPTWFKYDLVWEKSRRVGFLNANVMPLRCHEMIYIFGNPKKSNGVKKIYNPQMTEGGKPYIRKEEKLKNSVYGSKIKAMPAKNHGTRYPKSVIKFTSVMNTRHPTQKPDELCEYLIRTYSNKGDTILDFCMGSGSTGRGCVNCNRDFIGIEKDIDIFNGTYEELYGHTTLYNNWIYDSLCL